MMILALKLLLTPLLIGFVTLAGRRWGPAASGLLTGLPLTSGPVSMILAFQYGRLFAARAAVGSLVGQASVCIFCLAYSLAALRTGWPASSAVSVLVFLLATALWDRFSWTLLVAAAFLLAVIGMVARFIPQLEVSQGAARPPRWDLPARMAIAAAFAFSLTTFAGVLGPQLSGLLSPFPIFGLILAAFTHRQQGAAAAMKLLRGLALGSLAFAGFFLVVGGLIREIPTGWVYLLATASAAGANLLAFRLESIRKYIPRRPPGDESPG